MSITIHNPVALLRGLVKSNIDINAAKRYVQTGSEGLGDATGDCYGHIHPEAGFWQNLGATLNQWSPGEVASYAWNIQRFKAGWLSKWAASHDQGAGSDSKLLEYFLAGPDAQERISAERAELAPMTPHIGERIKEILAEQGGDNVIQISGEGSPFEAFAAPIEMVNFAAMQAYFEAMDPREVVDKINEISKSHGHDPENPDSECETITKLRDKFGGLGA